MREFQIAERQYYGDDQLRHFVVPDGCVIIRAGAFAASALESVEIAPTVREIGKYAFGGLLFLEEIVIPEGVVEIKDMAFGGCMQLRRVVLPRSLTRVGHWLFYGCPGPVQVVIPREICARIPLDEWKDDVELLIEEELSSSEEETCVPVSDVREEEERAEQPSEAEKSEEATEPTRERAENAFEESPASHEGEEALESESAMMDEYARIASAECEWLDRPIAQLRLNRLALFSLKRGGIHTIGQLLEKVIHKLLEFGEAAERNAAEDADASKEKLHGKRETNAAENGESAILNQYARIASANPEWLDWPLEHLKLNRLVLFGLKHGGIYTIRQLMEKIIDGPVEFRNIAQQGAADGLDASAETLHEEETMAAKEEGKPVVRAIDLEPERVEVVSEEGTEAAAIEVENGGNETAAEITESVLECVEAVFEEVIEAPAREEAAIEIEDGGSGTAAEITESVPERGEVVSEEETEAALCEEAAEIEIENGGSGTMAECARIYNAERAWLETPIEDLNLGGQALFGLKYEGIHTIGQLLPYRVDEILHIRYINRRRMEEIIRKLEKFRDIAEPGVADESDISEQTPHEEMATHVSKNAEKTTAAEGVKPMQGHTEVVFEEAPEVLSSEETETLELENDESAITVEAIELEGVEVVSAEVFETELHEETAAPTIEDAESAIMAESIEPEPVEIVPGEATEEIAYEETVAPAIENGESGTAAESIEPMPTHTEIVSADALETKPHEETMPLETESDESLTMAECAHICKVEQEWLEEPVESLNLSTRAYNCLRRGRIDTIGQLLARRLNEVKQMKSMGRKSVEEIIEVLTKFGGSSKKDTAEPSDVSGETTHEAAIDEQSRNAEQEWFDRPIESLNLSIRAYNCLMRGGIDTVGKLMSCKEEDLLQIRNMGKNSLKEIMGKLESLGKPVGRSRDSQVPLSNLRLLVDQPIETLVLSGRPNNALKRNGIATVNTLAEMNREQVAELPNMGAHSENEVCEKLIEYLAAAQARGEAYLVEQKSPAESLLSDFLTEFIDAACGFLPGTSRADVTSQTVHAGKAFIASGNMDGAAFAEAMWRTDFFEQRLREKLKQLLNANAFDGISEEELAVAVPAGVPLRQLQELLGELEAGNELERRDGRCFPALETLDDYLARIPEERDRFCLNGKLRGDTMESMAQAQGITRERIRQIFLKAARKYFPAQLCLKEDRYAGLYQKYALDPKEFRVIFRERVQTCEYLKTRYQGGVLPLDSAVDDASLPRGLRVRIRDYLESTNSGYLTVDGRRIPLERTALIDFVIRNFCRDTMDANAFAKLYNQFLRTHGVEDERLYISEDTRRYIETRLPENRHLLWSRNRRLRFYDIDAGDYSELLETLDLGAYHDIEISTRKFMLDYPQLMQRYDIRDEYELHNLLKKIGAERENATMSFGRMPMLSFGNVDRSAFVRAVLMECAPCDRDTLIHAVSERTGVLPETVGGTWLPCVDSYYYAGMYTVDSPEMPEAEAARLRAALTEDAYTLEEIAHLYRRAGGTDESLLTPYNLKQLGFLVFSRLAVRNARSASDYFIRKLTESNVVDYSELARRFGLITTFTSVLNALKDSYEVIEFEPHQLIQLRKLQSFGVDRPQLRAFCDAVAESVPPGALFSMKLLRERGMEFELDALGFEETFYNSLLREDERFDYCRMGNKTVFRRREPGDEPRPLSRTDLAAWMLRDRESMDVDEMAEEIRRDFGVEIDRYDLKMACEQAGFYWDSIMNRVYQSYEIYYDEV